MFYNCRLSTVVSPKAAAEAAAVAAVAVEAEAAEAVEGRVT